MDRHPSQLGSELLNLAGFCDLLFMGNRGGLSVVPCWVGRRWWLNLHCGHTKTMTECYLKCRHTQKLKRASTSVSPHCHAPKQTKALIAATRRWSLTSLVHTAQYAPFDRDFGATQGCLSCGQWLRQPFSHMSRNTSWCFPKHRNLGVFFPCPVMPPSKHTENLWIPWVLTLFPHE